tara:strand:- start:215 stop:667 length:453 start_codon:yes stop_codon:yes gene_type:complete
MFIPRKEPPSNYLKYWRVVRYFIQAKYKLTTAELEMMLFLYDEDYFSKDKFKEFDELLSWDVNRFDKLLQNGWISVFRKRSGKTKGLYEVSYKGRRMLSTMYKKLNGEEIPESPSVNPIFLKNVSYTDKVYRNMIIEMNLFIRQQRHLAP